MADYQLTQTGAEVQNILDNSQTGKYFYNQTVATWSSDATYSDYPYKGVITLTGVKGTDGVEVTFSNADATSGNYSPICNTVANGVEIWAKAQDNGLIIPTIHITTGADVQLSGDDAYLPISGGNITGSLSVVGNRVMTANEIASQMSELTSSKGTLQSWSRVRKSGNVVTLSFQLTTTTAISSFVAILTVPSAYAPSVSLNFCAPIQINGSVSFQQVQVLDSGDVRVGIGINSGTVFGMTLAYII